jgi:hypothetical protein
MSYVSGYYRRHPAGSRRYVNGYQSNREETISRKTVGKRRLCQDCGAHIRPRGMRSGMIVTYEAGDGLTSVKHFCAHVGEGLSRIRDGTTLDLFARDQMPPGGHAYKCPALVAPP